MLQIGARIPDLDVLDDRGQRIPVRSLLGSGGLVLWFYPKDDTPG